MRRLLTFAEAADCVRLHPAVIRALLRARRLHCTSTWRGARIDRDELIRAVEEYRRERDAGGAK
jgi:hypothetical protein